MQVWAERQKPPGPDRRALAAIVLCAALPVLIGFLLTSGSGQPEPRATATHPSAGHWVYVAGRGIAVHVDGETKRVDATVEIGSAPTGSPVVQDRHAAYLIDDDRVVLFGVDGEFREAPSAGVAEQPVTLEENGSAYLVYQQAGLIVRLGAKPVTTQAEGVLGAPVVTPNGELWTYQVDSGKLCLLTEEATLSCPGSVPAGHTGALAVLDGRAGFVDVTAGTWQELGAAGEPVRLGESLPPNAAVAARDVGGRLAIVDPARHRLLLIAPGGDAVAVPLGDRNVGPPLSTGAAVAVVDVDTGALTSYDAKGRRRAELTVASGEIRLTTGADGRGYADSADGLQTVVMDDDGTLTSVHTTGEPPPTHRPPEATPSATLPPATVAPTTTETVPPAPETVTETVTPTTTTTPPAGTPPPAATGTGSPRPPAGDNPDDPPAPPADRPKVDVLSAAAAGPGQATLEIGVSGPGPVFCHVFFNSVERAATTCDGTMTVVANGLAPNMTYDVYVLGTNAAGTGVPGRRAVLRT